MDALTLENLSFAYGTGQFALSDISVSIPNRSFATVVGANGAGKTTLFRLACAILNPSAGVIRVSGEDIRAIDRAALARRVAFVGQFSPAATGMTVEDHVLLGRIPYARAFAFTTDDDFRRADEAMRITDCHAYRTRRVDDLSGGERQRVLVARALAQEPRVLLLDEPNSHLDVSHQLAMFRALQAWQAHTGGTVVASTHDLNLASMFSSLAIVLTGGRLAAAGNPADVFTAPLLDGVFNVRTDVIPGYYGPNPAVHLCAQ